MEEKKIETYAQKKGNSLFISFIALLIGALGMYLFIEYTPKKEDNKTTTVVNKSEKEVTVVDNGIADAVEKLYDAVVVVEVFTNDTLSATGTGFVYQKDGKKAYILTNNHVVEGNKVAVKVKFTDEREEDVTIEGQDEFSDLAVLSLDQDKVEHVADIGNSEQMRLGDTVFTVGAPLNSEYYWTVTRGVLSGKDRMVEVSLTNSQTSDYVMKVLQTDASINSGNSGGPLANSNGEVIGITNMKLVSSGVEGIGFAIPIEDAIDYAEKIIKGEEIQRPLLGVKMMNLAERLGLYQQGITLNTELTDGVVVIEVQKDSPASKGGLKRGDIITKVGDYKIKNVATLRYALYRYSVGDTIDVTYEREGKEAHTSFKLTVANS